MTKELNLLIDRVEGRSHQLADMLRLACRVNDARQYLLGWQDREGEYKAADRRQCSYDADNLQRRYGEKKA